MSTIGEVEVGSVLEIFIWGRARAVVVNTVETNRTYTEICIVSNYACNE